MKFLALVFLIVCGLALVGCGKDKNGKGGGGSGGGPGAAPAGVPSGTRYIGAMTIGGECLEFRAGSNFDQSKIAQIQSGMELGAQTGGGSFSRTAGCPRTGVTGTCSTTQQDANGDMTVTQYKAGDADTLKSECESNNGTWAAL